MTKMKRITYHDARLEEGAKPYIKLLVDKNIRFLAAIKKDNDNRDFFDNFTQGDIQIEYGCLGCENNMIGIYYPDGRPAHLL